MKSDSYEYSLLKRCLAEIKEHNNDYDHVTKELFIAELEIYLENVK